VVFQPLNLPVTPRTTAAAVVGASLQVGVACVRLDGGMSLEQRDAVIKTFTNDPKVRARAAL
jgi:hypothetical protein